MFTHNISEAYRGSAQRITELFSEYLEFDDSAPALVVSTNPANKAVRNALEKTFESFGYEAANCIYVTLFPCSLNAEENNITLDPQALFVLTEGLDPLFVVATDTKSTNTIAQAYRMQLRPNAYYRVFGRPSAVFDSLETMLQTNKGKRHAWQILKALRP